MKKQFRCKKAYGKICKIETVCKICEILKKIKCFAHREGGKFALKRGGGRKADTRMTVGDHKGNI